MNYYRVEVSIDPTVNYYRVDQVTQEDQLLYQVFDKTVAWDDPEDSWGVTYDVEVVWLFVVDVTPGLALDQAIKFLEEKNRLNKIYPE